VEHEIYGMEGIPEEFLSDAAKRFKTSVNLTQPQTAAGYAAAAARALLPQVMGQFNSQHQPPPPPPPPNQYGNYQGNAPPPPYQQGSYQPHQVPNQYSGNTQAFHPGHHMSQMHQHSVAAPMQYPGARAPYPGSGPATTSQPPPPPPPRPLFPVPIQNSPNGSSGPCKSFQFTSFSSTMCDSGFLAFPPSFPPPPPAPPPTEPAPPAQDFILVYSDQSLSMVSNFNLKIHFMFLIKTLLFSCGCFIHLKNALWTTPLFACQLQ